MANSAATPLDMVHLNEACLADRKVIPLESTLVPPHFFTRVEAATIGQPGRPDSNRSSSGIEQWARRRTRLKRNHPKRPPELRMTPLMTPGASREPPALNRPLRAWRYPVASYLPDLPPRQLLRRKLRETMIAARARLEGRLADEDAPE